MSVLEQNSRRKMLLGQDGNALVLLLSLLMVGFILINFVKVVYLVSGDTQALFVQQVLNWAVLPSRPELFLSRPWTLLSYMFVHASIWHLVTSVLWLGCYGYILQHLAGNKKIVPLFLYGGFVGGLVFLIANSAIPQLRSAASDQLTLMGAGPASLALAVGTTLLAPHYKLFPHIKGGISLWILSFVFIIASCSTSFVNSPLYLIAQVAGALMGVLFVWQLKRGNDWSEWMISLADWVENLFNPDKKSSSKPPAQQLFYKTNRQPYQKTPHVTQQRIDELLDKINQKGYHFLTDEEKDFLKKASTEEF